MSKKQIQRIITCVTIHLSIYHLLRALLQHMILPINLPQNYNESAIEEKQSRFGTDDIATNGKISSIIETGTQEDFITPKIFRPLLKEEIRKNNNRRERLEKTL